MVLQCMVSGTSESSAQLGRSTSFLDRKNHPQASQLSVGTNFDSSIVEILLLSDYMVNVKTQHYKMLKNMKCLFQKNQFL